jgi:hypothetical protein
VEPASTGSTNPMTSAHPARLRIWIALGVVLTFLLLFAGTAIAAEKPSSEFNKAGVTHNDQCLPLSGSTAIMHSVNGTALTNEDGDVADGPESVECAESSKDLYVEGIESVKAASETMYYVWSQNGSPGFVRANELTLKSGQPKLNGGDAAGNGATAEAAPGEPYYTVTPTYIPAQQCYPEIAGGKAGQNCGSEYYHYEPYGQPTGNDPHYTLMTWSWINVGGGGIAKAAVSEGMHFYPSNVRPLTETSYTEHGEANGSVTARYGSVNSGEKLVYGWMVTSHDYGGQCTNHMSYTGGTPLAETLCAGAGTTAASSLTPTAAQLNGTVVPNGSPARYHFQWGLTASYGKELAGGETGSAGTAGVSGTLSGLAPGETYHYRVVAENSLGATYGPDQAFTLPGPVEAVTGEASNVGETEATLNGTVDPRGYEATYQYEYGPTTSYGSAAPAPAGPAGASNTAEGVSTRLTELLPGVVYHYRLVAKSGGITSMGADHTLFTTPSAPSAIFDPSGNGNQYVATEGSSNALYVATYSSGKWSGPFEETSGGDVYSTPSAEGNSAGNIFWAYRGPENRLYVSVRNPSTGAVEGPYSESEKNDVYSSPSAISNAAGNIFWAYRGPENRLYVSVRNPSTGAVETSSESGTGKVYSAPVAISNAAGYIFWAYEGPENRLYVSVRNPSTGAVEGPYSESEAGKVYSAPSAISNSAGNFFWAYEGPENRLYVSVRNPSTGLVEGPYSESEKGYVSSTPSASSTSGGEILWAYEGSENAFDVSVRNPSTGVVEGPYKEAERSAYSGPGASTTESAGNSYWFYTGTNDTLATQEHLANGEITAVKQIGGTGTG